MTYALGMIEVYGVPTAMAVADAMCKGGQVRLTGFENTDLGKLTVLIRGAVAEVKAAVAAGLAEIPKVYGSELLSHHIIALPYENLEYVLPIGYSETMSSLELDIRFPPPLSA